MMLTLICTLNALIFTALGGLHLYWMGGGRWGLRQALPSTPSGAPLFQPGLVACAVVGVGLMGFAVFWAMLASGEPLPFGAGRWGTWASAAIFSLRAVGDFRYVGLFRRVRDTDFGRMDGRWYTPLCVYLGLSSAYAGWLTGHVH
ncbi:MAG TPA: DUF3995 domain-containing protein [Saprospiraceae bacterium]|nr:DUF3995 domain-containing protein [Saprospiraceae bacterium]HNG89731.1 DUF3995 domain-containing protein [Saprospiraceae bacterium]